MPTTMAPIRLAGSALREHRHVCAFFRSPEEEYRILLPFLRDGVEQGDRGVTVMPRQRGDHLARLRGGGIDVDAARRNGRLELLVSEETYLRGGHFDQEAMLATLQEVLSDGHRRGYPLTRLVAHAEYLMEDWESATAFVEYEMRLNHLLPSFPDAVICTYDLEKVSAAVVMDVLRTHPIAIIGGVLQENPFFAPPDAFLAEIHARRERRRVARERRE